MIKKSKILMALMCSMLLTTAINDDVQAAFPTIKRLGGADRYETSVKIAKEGWTSSYYAVLACGEDYPDALSSVPLAKKYDAPIFLSHRSYLDSETLNEIVSLKVGKIFVIGEAGSINNGVVNQLNSLGIQTERLGGSDRYETSVKIAEKFGNAKTVTVATGEDYGDALSIGPAAAVMGAPIVLVPKNYVPESTKKYIRDLNTIRNSEYGGTSGGEFRNYKVFIMGDTSVVSDNVAGEFEGKDVERIVGENKYVRNINAIGRFVQKSGGKEKEKGSGDNKYTETQYSTENDMLSFNNIYVSSGEGFADALSGAALAAKTKSPIILSSSSNIPLLRNFILEKLPNYNSNTAIPEYITALGGEGVMPQDTINQIFGITAFDKNVGFNDSDSVLFKDKAFEKIVRDKVNIHDRDIHYSDVRNITELNLSNQGIQDITGIENFTSLKSLDLSYNEIEEIEFLLRLDQIEDLNLSHNKIKDISYLSNLVSLKQLNLSDNKIDDIGYSRKRYKDRDDTEYDKISENVFKNLTHITSLDLSNSDASSYYEGNRIRSVSNLKVLFNLTSLNLKGNDVTNLDDLKDINTLNTLNLRNTDISNLDFIEDMTNLSWLDISSNRSIDGDDLKSLKKLTKLKYLDASNNDIDDISSLRDLTSLTTLYIEDNPIKDYTPILSRDKSLYYKDFKLWPVVGNAIYSTDPVIDSQIKDQIVNFQNMYGYGDYSKLKYTQLYHSYDLGAYDSQLKNLYSERDWTTYKISMYSGNQNEMNRLKDKLDNINNGVEDITRKENMNKKVKDLENELLATSTPKEKEKILNKINYTYSDYKYDYYRNLNQRLDNDIEKIKEYLIEANGDNPSYGSSTTIEYLQYKLDQVQRDRDFAYEKVSMYENYKDFFNAVTAVLDQY